MSLTRRPSLSDDGFGDDRGLVGQHPRPSLLSMAPAEDGFDDDFRDGRAVVRARSMTRGGYRLLASANLGELVLGCVEAKFCK